MAGLHRLSTSTDCRLRHRLTELEEVFERIGFDGGMGEGKVGRNLLPAVEDLEEWVGGWMNWWRRSRRFE